MFKLPLDGVHEWHKATNEQMVHEFGQGERTRRYFVLKKAKSKNRKIQPTWFIEKILVLVKVDYMSKDNFGLIAAAESGILFNWAQIVYNRFVMEVNEGDKRKQSRTSKIPAFLGMIFEHAKVGSLKLALSQSNLGRTEKPGSGKGRRSISLTVQDDSEPPPKKMKTETNVIDQSTSSTSQIVEQGTEKAKQEQDSGNEVWDQDLTGDLIPRPVSRQGRVQSIPAKKISIKLGKQKTSEKVQEAKVVDLFKDVDPNEQTELVPVTVDMKQGNTNAMRASTVIKNLNDTVQFVERQQKYAMSLQMTITTLRDSNNALISMYQDEKVKTANFDKLVQGVKELREFFKAEARAKE